MRTIELLKTKTRIVCHNNCAILAQWCAIGTFFGTVACCRSTARIFFEIAQLFPKSLVFSRIDLVYLRPLGLSFDRGRRSTNAFAHWISDRGQAAFYFKRFF